MIPKMLIILIPCLELEQKYLDATIRIQFKLKSWPDHTLSSTWRYKICSSLLFLLQRFKQVLLVFVYLSGCCILFPWVDSWWGRHRKISRDGNILTTSIRGVSEREQKGFRGLPFNSSDIKVIWQFVVFFSTWFTCLKSTSTVPFGNF